jgi:thioredoxin reductase
MPRPEPRPGTYPVVVVGSGPGGLQTSYCLSRLGVEHAVISRDDRPGGMFRLYPIFERLLSWSEPEAVAMRETPEYEAYDQNSLLGDKPEHRACVAEVMLREEGREFVVPRRDEMEQGLATFAARTGLPVRYGCEWLATRREDDGFVLETTGGEYRCRFVVFALGVTDPWKSPIPGIEHVPHYADAVRDRRAYAGKDVLIIGKRNSAFELADGIEPYARRIYLVSPRTVNTSVVALSTVRVRYMQPLERHQIGGGTFALDAAVNRIEHVGERVVIHASGTTHPGEVAIEGDVAIAATGFATPLRDLPDLGVTTVAQGRIPALTPFWESATVPGIFFAGNATQGAAGPRRHGVGSSSAAVHGFRYNARVLARRLARRLGSPAPRDQVSGDGLVNKILTALTESPALWAQKGYLTLALEDDGSADVLPLSFFFDAECRERFGATIEMNAQGEVYPVVYTREGLDIHEHILPSHPLRDYRSSEEHRRQLESLL